MRLQREDGLENIFYKIKMKISKIYQNLCDSIKAFLEEKLTALDAYCGKEERASVYLKRLEEQTKSKTSRGKEMIKSRKQ